MAAKSRDLLISKGGTRIAGIKSKSVPVAKEGIDITSDEDDGYRLFLADPGTKQIDISFSGVTKDAVLRDLLMSDGSPLLTDITIEWPPIGAELTGAQIEGDFYFNGFTENGGDPAGSLEFSGTLQSSGPWTYTPGA